MLSTLRQRLAVSLIILLPFHAFLVTVLTKIIAGSGHAPLGWLAIWKEALLAVILFVALIEIIRQITTHYSLLTTRQSLIFDALDCVIILSVFLGFFVSIFNFQFSIFNFAYGVKYDFLPLVAFLILRRVPWSAQFFNLVLRSILIVGSIVAGYGIITAFLPAGFFSWLGYSPIHSLYFSDGPIAAFQFIGNTGVRRIQSVMSGPNQLGLWLLIPLSVWLVQIRSWKVSGFWFLVSGLMLGVGLLLTFSRSAWIGAFVMTMVAIAMAIPTHLRKKIIGTSISLALLVGIGLIVAFPSVFGRLGSTRGHWERPMEAVRIMIDHPFGLGLGTAGPASNRGTDTCVHLRPQDDPAWAKPITNLCVFLGKVQVQPTDRACNCPLLTENWYLQWGVEMGVIGFALSLVLIFFVLRKLIMDNGKWIIVGKDRQALSIINYQLSISLVYIGLSLAALFLHAWEDAAVAYTVWMMVAVHDSINRMAGPR
ncbi:MAG: hypothetical protein PHZ00_06075 [Candidatus Peribacteraceae bacterium]|nr:hypothetical protein [Candidatus Peribacteraceae bacterium]